MFHVLCEPETASKNYLRQKLLIIVLKNWTHMLFNFYLYFFRTWCRFRRPFFVGHIICWQICSRCFTYSVHQERQVKIIWAKCIDYIIEIIERTYCFVLICFFLLMGYRFRRPVFRPLEWIPRTKSLVSDCNPDEVVAPADAKWEPCLVLHTNKRSYDVQMYTCVPLR